MASRVSRLDPSNEQRARSRAAIRSRPAKGSDPSRRAAFDFAKVAVRSGADLVLGPADDPLEKEADRVMNISERSRDVEGLSPPIAESRPNTLQRKCSECEEEVVQRKINTAAPAFAPAPRIVHDVLSSPGRPLDRSARKFMEGRFQRDFSRVEVHTDSRAAASAKASQARAYTVGEHIVFGDGEYMPETSEGRRLLAHELAHVAQQQGAPRVVRRVQTTGAPISRIRSEFSSSSSRRCSSSPRTFQLSF